MSTTKQAERSWSMIDPLYVSDLTDTVRVLRGILTVLEWIDDGLLRGLDQDEVRQVSYALVLAAEIMGKTRF